MVETEGRSGGGGWLAFIVGGLLVAVLAIGFFVFYNGAPVRTADTQPSVDLNIETPALPEAPALPPPPEAPTPAPDLPSPTPEPAPAE